MNLNKGPRVLVIDDDRPLTRVISLILEPEGYLVKVVETRDEALTVLGAERHEVIIMDYLMPGLEASGFIAACRTIGYEGPILLCSAMHGELNLPVDDVLQKPFDPDDLPKNSRGCSKKPGRRPTIRSLRTA